MHSHKEQTDEGRLLELDFLKGVLILLVIAFHLVFIEQKYPYAKLVVYTFHMPAFLVVSGFLMNFGRPVRQFLRVQLRFFVPYLVLESGYVLMASVLPIREHIDVLTPWGFLERLFVHPLGPYWYLQTLMVCGCAAYVVLRFVPLKLVSRVLLLAITFSLLSRWLGVVSFFSCCYFLAGVVLRQSGVAFRAFFQPSLLAFVAFCMLVVRAENLLPSSAGGVLVIWLAVSIILCLHRWAGRRVAALLCFLGRRTLPLFLYSPIFTLLCKPLARWLQAEPTGLLFLLIALAVCVGGSLAVSFVVRRCLLMLFRKDFVLKIRA
jgi:fucose 4-O-acetylase-like acetyltransferase